MSIHIYIEIPPPQECSRPTPGAYRANPVKSKTRQSLPSPPQVRSTYMKEQLRFTTYIGCVWDTHRTHMENEHFKMDQTRDVARAYKFTRDTQPWEDLTCRRPQYNTCPALFSPLHEGTKLYIIHSTAHRHNFSNGACRGANLRSQAGGCLHWVRISFLHLGTASRSGRGWNSTIWNFHSCMHD